MLPTCERLGLGLHPVLPARERAAHRARCRASTRRSPARVCTAGRSTTTTLDRVERLRAWAEAHGVSLLEVAIGGLAAVSPVASVIAGATKPEQVRANAAAGEWTPSPEELADLLAL